MLDQRLRPYMTAGGFPEAEVPTRVTELRCPSGYVDVVVLRDVIERHDVKNQLALR